MVLNEGRGVKIGSNDSGVKVRERVVCRVVTKLKVV